MPDKKYLYLFTITLVLGVITAQFLPAKGEQADFKFENAALVDTVEQMEGEVAQLEKELSSLRAELNELQEQAAGEKNIAENMKIKLQSQQKLAGLAEVTSPGIIITIDDNYSEAEVAKSSGEKYNPNDYVIHDKNLLYLVNELKAAKAKAIAINNQRITAATDIRCVGTVVTVNSRRVAPPFIITALGNPTELKKKIENGREYSYLKDNKFPTEIKTTKKTTVPAYNGSFNTKYLTKVEQYHYLR